MLIFMSEVLNGTQTLVLVISLTFDIVYSFSFYCMEKERQNHKFVILSKTSTMVCMIVWN